jgi:hypothetical protein
MDLFLFVLFIRVNRCSSVSPNSFFLLHRGGLAPQPVGLGLLVILGLSGGVNGVVQLRLDIVFIQGMRRLSVLKDSIFFLSQASSPAEPETANFR